MLLTTESTFTRRQNNQHRPTRHCNNNGAAASLLFDTSCARHLCHQRSGHQLLACAHSRNDINIARLLWLLLLFPLLSSSLPTLFVGPNTSQVTTKMQFCWQFVTHLVAKQQFVNRPESAVQSTTIGKRLKRRCILMCHAFVLNWHNQSCGQMNVLTCFDICRNDADDGRCPMTPKLLPCNKHHWQMLPDDPHVRSRHNNNSNDSFWRQQQRLRCATKASSWLPINRGMKERSDVNFKKIHQALRTFSQNCIQNLLQMPYPKLCKSTDKRHNLSWCFCKRPAPL